MQTLQKPRGPEEKSRKSSTCQPGSVSIKYSDMLLVEPQPTPSWATNIPPPLLLLAVLVVKVEFLDMEGGFEIAGEEVETDFFIKGWGFGSVTVASADLRLVVAVGGDEDV